MRSLGMAVLSLALLGWVAACAGTNGMMDKKMDSDMSGSKGMTDKKMDSDMSGSKGMMDPEADAMLMGSGGHHAAGKVAFGMGMNDRHVLTLSDLKVDKVPDGYVYLTRDADWMHGVQLGMLKQFSGTVSSDSLTKVLTPMIG